MEEIKKTKKKKPKQTAKEALDDTELLPGQKHETPSAVDS
jgi:hypothetical protein